MPEDDNLFHREMRGIQFIIIMLSFIVNDEKGCNGQ